MLAKKTWRTDPVARGHEGHDALTLRSDMGPVRTPRRTPARAPTCRIDPHRVPSGGDGCYHPTCGASGTRVSFGKGGAPLTDDPLLPGTMLAQLAANATVTRKRPIVFPGLKRRTSSKRTSREAHAATPNSAETMESFLIAGSVTVMIAPFVSVMRTDDGRSSGINARGLRVVGCQLWHPVSSPRRSAAMNRRVRGTRVLI